MSLFARVIRWGSADVAVGSSLSERIVTESTDLASVADEREADEDYLRWINGNSDPVDDAGDGGPDIDIEMEEQQEQNSALGKLVRQNLDGLGIHEAYEGGMPGGDDDMGLFKKHGDALNDWARGFFLDVFSKTKDKDIPMSANQGRLYWIFYNKMMGAAAAAAAKAGGEAGPPDEAEKLAASGLTPETASLIVRARNAMRADLVSGMAPHERRAIIDMERRALEDGGFKSEKARDYFAKLVHTAENAEPDEGIEGLKLKHPPSKYQKAIFDWIEDVSKKPEGAMVVDAKAGSGKCLGFDTPVMMANGLIKPVQEVKPGDVLMGPDGEPREVRSVNKGHGDLFQIKPVKGESWVCNDVHVLTLVNSPTGEVFDLPLNDYLRYPRPSRLRDAKLFRVSIPLETRDTVLDPYLVGLWLGDGTVGMSQITNSDTEIHDYLRSVASDYGVEAKIKNPEGRCAHVNLTGENHRAGAKGSNIVLNEFKRCYANGEKRVPDNYLRNNRETRLRLLAGLLDTDGYYSNGYYELVTKYDGLRDDVLYLARSLGFAAYSRVKIGRIVALDFEGKYHRITISGHLDVIPCLVGKKKAAPRKQKKNVLRTGFKAHYIGKGDYYGFTLDRDGRFLLGDFTVTHNTSTIQAALTKIPTDQEVVFLAFNKKIAGVLEKATRSVPNVLASTLGSFGYAACRKAYPGCQLDEKKVFKIIDAVVPDKKVNKRYSSDLNNLIDKRKMLLTEDENGDPVLPSWADVAEKFKVDIPVKKNQTKTDVKQGIVSGPMFLEMLDKIWDENLADTKTVNFADQVFFPAFHNLPFADKRQGLKTFNPDWVMVDEAQDLSPTDRLLVQRIAPRTVIVGDPNQSIYAFKGADPDSMDKIKQKLGAEEKPLSICYRCPKKIVEAAQAIVPTIEAAPNAEEGEIHHIEHDDLLSFVKPKDHVLCRTTAPLVTACLTAIAAGRKANVMGRNIGDSLANLVVKIAGKKGKEMPLLDFRKKLDAWEKKEIKRLEKQGKEHLIEGVQDKYDSLIAMMEVEGIETPVELTKRIDEVFADEAPGIVFSTVHKAKGLEAPNVFIIRPDLMPHPIVMKKGTAADQQQEANIQYVAITRAQKSLTWVAPPPKDGKSGGGGGGGSRGSGSSPKPEPKPEPKPKAKPKAKTPSEKQADLLAMLDKLDDKSTQADWESVDWSRYGTNLFERIAVPVPRLDDGLLAPKVWAARGEMPEEHDGIALYYGEGVITKVERKGVQWEAESDFGFVPFNLLSYDDEKHRWVHTATEEK